MAYGVDRRAVYRRAATSMERPSKFEFIVNLAAADALGLAIPPEVLQQATERVR